MEEKGEVQHDVGEDHLLGFTARSSADETWANLPDHLKNIENQIASKQNKVCEYKYSFVDCKMRNWWMR